MIVKGLSCQAAKAIALWVFWGCLNFSAQINFDCMYCVQWCTYVTSECTGNLACPSEKTFFFGKFEKFCKKYCYSITIMQIYVHAKYFLISQNFSYCVIRILRQFHAYSVLIQRNFPRFLVSLDVA